MTYTKKNTTVKYTLAVSGGADSVVMLDLMSKQFDPRHLVVAHYDHGLREDSADDARFVRGLAEHYGIRFETERGDLKDDSELTARNARHQFLAHVSQKHGAQLATAHHQDDVFETAAINAMRGTGIDGVVNMLADGPIKRPLINWTRQQIMIYAIENGLEWSYDSTNSDMRYTRNRYRSKLQLIHSDDRSTLASRLNQLKSLRQEQIELLQSISDWIVDETTDSDLRIRLERFVLLPMVVRTAALHHILRCRGAASNITRSSLTELAMFACRASHGKMYKLNQSVTSQIDSEQLLLKARRSPWRTPTRRKPIEI